MNQKKFMGLGALTAVVIGVAFALTARHSNQQADLGGSMVFADLKPALGDIEEIHFAKGDGSRTTLRKAAGGWTVVERQYPADASRVRELALALANLKVIERKTSDPANYARIGVEPPDTPTAASTLVEVVAGKKTWSLIVGKGADGRAVYVRKPAEAVSSLAQPFISPDPDQKRWIDRLVTDIPGASVHDIAVKTGSGSAYLLTRAEKDTDFVLSPIPKGRTAVSPMSLNSQADALAGFNFDDVRAAPASATATDAATYRTFDGQVIEFAGHREGEKAFVAVAVHRDAELAAKFPAAAPGKPAPAGAAAPATQPANQTVEKLASRAKGVEYEIPAYKYEAIFRKPDDLLEKPPEPPKKK